MPIAAGMGFWNRSGERWGQDLSAAWPRSDAADMAEIVDGDGGWEMEAVRQRE